MKVAVLGSGNGGVAVAFDCAAHGHSVRLFDFERFPDTIAAVAKSGEIRSEGELEGFASVAYAGHDDTGRGTGRGTRRVRRPRPARERGRGAGREPAHGVATSS